MGQRNGLILAVFLGAFASASQDVRAQQGGPPATPAALDCPASLSVTSATAAVPGWQAVNSAPGPLPLESIAIRTAPASATGLPQSSFLRLEQGDRRTIHATWELTGARRSHPNLWLACVYTGTTIALVRPLLPEVRLCEFQVESTEASLTESASCR